MIIQSLSSGFRTAATSKRFIVLFYSCNLLIAAMVAWPMSLAISGFAGNSLSARALVSRLDPVVLFEFIRYNGGVISLAGGLIVAAFCLQWFVMLFLSAGILAYYLGEGHRTSAHFWTATAIYSGRFFRLFLWSIPWLLLFYGIQFLELLGVRIVGGSDPASNMTYWGTWVRVAIGFLGIILYETALDYAKIDLLVTGEYRTRSSMLAGLRMMFRHPVKTIGLSLSFFLISMALLAGYIDLAPVLGPARGFVLILAILLQQCYIFLRTTIKLSLLAAEVRMRSLLIPAEATPVQPNIAEWFEHQI
jgi:hypothetical protein